MKDYIVAVLQSMAEKGSSILRLMFKENGTDIPSEETRESIRQLLSMEYNGQVVMDLDTIASLEDVRVRKDWSHLKNRTIILRTTGTFNKMLFVETMSFTLENIELLQERQQKP
ncbi:MAG: hypothetical protein QG653_68 [Patescibacteria group bacterium]|nr:hypothetical protein [Patescibacteria group bacterium]